jgi:TPP-dependent pyruvate/acetoin dehydrogenase alpha subunit
MDFTKEELLEMYDDIVLARALGENIVQFIIAGHIPGGIHPCLGQEAISAGIIAAFKKSDIKTHGTGTHRSQTIMAYRVGLGKFIGEVLCRTGGINDGVSGEYHITDLDTGMIPATGALGGAWGELAGYAWGLKNDGAEREIAFAPYGDGAASQGSTYEAMNIAALYKLPILFFIENNGIAMATPVDKQSPLENLSDRAPAFNMKGVTVDGNDPIAVAEAVLTGMELAADNEPSLVEAKTIRWGGHYVGDDQAYRDLGFRDHLDDIDPVLIYEKKLIEMGYLTDEEAKRVRAEKKELIESTFAEELKKAPPTRDQALDYNRIYSNDAGGEL